MRPCERDVRAKATEVRNDAETASIAKPARLTGIPASEPTNPSFETQKSVKFFLGVRSMILGSDLVLVVVARTGQGSFQLDLAIDLTTRRRKPH